MQIQAKKNTAYYLCWPMVNTAAPEAFLTGESVTDTAYYKDGAGAWTSLAITDTAAEIGSTGIYEIDLTASEMNHDKILIKFTSTSGADTAFLLDTRTELAEDLGNGSGQVTLLTATQASIDNIETDTNSLNDTKVPQTLNLTASGNIGIDWANVENPTTSLDLSATSIQLVDTATAVTGVSAGGITAASIATDAIDADALAADAIAEINATVDTALTDIGLDHLLGASVTGTDVTDNSIVARLVSSSATADWDDFVNTTDSLQATRDALTSVASDVTDILTDTGTTLPGTLSTLTTNLATVDGIVDSILLDTAEIGTAGAGLTDLGGMSTGMKAEVNAEIVDVLRTDTATELSGVPAASPALHTMMQWVYMVHRNKVTSTATATTVNNDAGSAIGTSTDSDDTTTFTRGEFA